MSKPKRPPTPSPSVLSGEQRINKLLAAAGLGSRRTVDELITDGRVEIDGKTITQVGTKVDVETAKISVDGEPLKRHRPAYFAVHKPAGVLCTNRDPEGRPRVIDLVPGHNRLFPVGRLDSSSTGLILLTNDGELAQRLAHPRNSVPKSYFVVVAGQVEMDSMRRLQRGIYLAEGLARVDGAKIRKVRKGCTEIEITLSEGKNREIRRVLARLGHKVITLRRVAIGPLRLGAMPEGSYRPLTQDEVRHLYKAVEDIKREKKIQRKEKDRRRSAEMNGVGEEAVEVDRLDATAPAKAPIKIKEAAEPKEERRVKKKKKLPRESDDESLPPLSINPYREPEDELEEDSGFKDSVLVKHTGSDSEVTIRPGKVLSYSDDDSFEDADDEDDFDSTGMGFDSFAEDDDEEGDDEEAFEEADEATDRENNLILERAPKGRKAPIKNKQDKNKQDKSLPEKKVVRAVRAPSGSRKSSARPTGPNSGVRGKPMGRPKRSVGKATRNGPAANRAGAAGASSGRGPTKGAVRRGTGFGANRPSGPREGSRSGASTRNPSEGSSRSARSFGGSTRPGGKRATGGSSNSSGFKGKSGGGKGRSQGKRGGR